MYTFIISISFFFLLSTLIFNKKIKENLFTTIMIVFLGTLVTNVIVSNILGKNIGYKTVFVKEKELSEYENTLNDSTNYITYFDISNNNILIYDRKIKYPSEISFHFYKKGDTISKPKFKKFIMKKDVKDNKWVTRFNFPNINRHFQLYLPNDSFHHKKVELAMKILKNNENEKKKSN